MESLKEKFICDFNPDTVADLFEELFNRLHAIHFEGKYIPNLNMDNIVFNDKDDAGFVNIKPMDDPEKYKGENIRALAKIMIGCYLSQGPLFNDLSYTEDSWFVDNLDTIFKCINYPEVDKDYFYFVFKEKKNYYYSDYINRKRQNEQLENASQSQKQGFRKVLRGAGSELYRDVEEIDKPSEVKTSAKIHTAFNPLLIGISIAIIFIIITMVVLLN